MIQLFKQIWNTGTVTMTKSVDNPPERFRGKPVVQDEWCNGCEACVKMCPTQAISIVERKTPPLQFRLDYSKCLFCGLCEEVCEPGALTMGHEYRLATGEKDKLLIRFDAKAKQDLGMEESTYVYVGRE
ncbi:4Fe-4S binding protein [Microaerobacter geothermalis]|uniref:4Fe-4S binding protein n=1 Tax=Microaerobacter geothermalis TaxID=674972 RepID=UPI001F2F191E|nr:4Fe-4S binding protein [Microaerobacter geothermalis]MCF6093063.1 4Fe-4S binding protein [Microaerobacter geothermalis]